MSSADHPLSLQSLCRLSIRRAVGRTQVGAGVPHLNLTPHLSSFLSYQRFVMDTGEHSYPIVTCCCCAHIQTLVDESLVSSVADLMTELFPDFTVTKCPRPRVLPATPWLLVAASHKSSAAAPAPTQAPPPPPPPPPPIQMEMR